MDFYKVKPSLVDTNIITQMHMIKKQSGGDTPVINKIVNKFTTDISSFVTNNFWLLLILFVLLYFLWCRYRWYTNYLKEQELKEREKIKRKKQEYDEKRRKKMLYQIMMEKKKVLEEKQNDEIDIEKPKKKKREDYDTYDGRMYASF